MSTTPSTTPSTTSSTGSTSGGLQQAAAPPALDWISPWAASKSLAVGAYTQGTAVTFSSTSNTAGYTQTGTINWTKASGLYTIGFATQVQIPAAPSTGAQVQQWVSPRWVVGDATSYAHYFCSTTTTAGTTAGTFATTASSSTFVSKTDLASITGTQSSTTAGQTAAAATNVAWRSAVWNQSSLSLQCATARDGADTGTQFAAVKVGTSFSFRAGFDYFRDTTTNQIAQSTQTTDFSFTLVDNGATALVSSVAAIVLSVSAFLF